MVRLPSPVRPLWPPLKVGYTHATGLAAPISQRLSRLRGGYLPSGCVESLEEAAATSGGRCLTARNAEIVERTLPQGVADDDPVFGPFQHEYIPRVAVAELPGGRVLGQHAALITRNGDFVFELSAYFGTKRWRQHPLFLHPFPGPPHEVEGRLGVLAIRGQANYYHFLMDVIPRLEILRQCPEIEPPATWYVSAHTTYQRELLDMAGVDRATIIDSAEVPHVTADCLVVPGTAGATPVQPLNPPWVVQHLRELLLPQVRTDAPPRPLYVSRGGSKNNRAIVDEDRLMAMLQARGFEVVDPNFMTVEEQIRAFATASTIVAGHGAALANLVFAREDAVLVELFPAGEIVSDYWLLASGVPGFEYRFMKGLGRRSRSRNTMLVNDIRVDFDALERLLDEVQR
jgi:capsular polysaccharide biosynthesis protein